MARTYLPVIAGWFDILAGIIGLLFVAFLALLTIGLTIGFGTTGGSQERIWSIFSLLAIPGILAIVGGVFSLRRRGWIMAIVGSICAAPLALGIVSLVLIILSRKEFKGRAPNGVIHVIE